MSGLWHNESIYTSLHLDFAGAWQMHPFVYLYDFILWFGIRRYILGISDTKSMENSFAMLGILMILFISGGCSGIFPETRQ